MEKIYKVEGMTCGGCTGSVTRALERALPGAAVVVSLDEGTATVSGAHDEAAARKAIEDAGFDVAA